MTSISKNLTWSMDQSLIIKLNFSLNKIRGFLIAIFYRSNIEAQIQIKYWSPKNGLPWFVLLVALSPQPRNNWFSRRSNSKKSDPQSEYNPLMISNSRIISETPNVVGILICEPKFLINIILTHFKTDCFDMSTCWWLVWI